MKYGVKHGLRGTLNLAYTLVRAEGDGAIARAEADPIAFFEDEHVANACSAALNAEWGVLAQLLDEYKISDPDPIRPLLDFARAQKLMLSKACEGAKTYGDSRMVDVCSVCHEPLYEHAPHEQKAPTEKCTGHLVHDEFTPCPVHDAPVEKPPAPSAPTEGTGPLHDLFDWALRAKWYLDSNCEGHEVADRLRSQMDQLVAKDILRLIALDVWPLVPSRVLVGKQILSRAKELCEEIETLPASAMQTHVSVLASQLRQLLSNVIPSDRPAMPWRRIEAKTDRLVVKDDDWDDKPDEWTTAIEAAHPLRSNSHDEYATAMKMISTRHSKHALVALVNWLLVTRDKTGAYERAAVVAFAERGGVPRSFIDAILRGAHLHVQHSSKAKEPTPPQAATTTTTIPLNPIQLFLSCPNCGMRHIDRGEFATKPHHTHACQGCGLTWRPAIEATVGVEFLPGFKDEIDDSFSSLRWAGWACSDRGKCQWMDRSSHFERRAGESCPRCKSGKIVDVFVWEAPTPKRLAFIARHGTSPVEGEEEKACTCREIQANDPKRHFKGCALRKEVIIGDAHAPLAEHSVSAHNTMIAVSGRCSVFACPSPTREFREGKIPAGAEIILSDGSTVTTKQETSFVFVVFDERGPRGFGAL